MKQLLAIFQVALGVIVGLMSLLTFSLALAALAYEDFTLLGPPGLGLAIGLVIGSSMLWVSWRLIVGTVRPHPA